MIIIIIMLKFYCRFCYCMIIIIMLWLYIFLMAVVLHHYHLVSTEHFWYYDLEYILATIILSTRLHTGCFPLSVGNPHSSRSSIHHQYCYIFDHRVSHWEHIHLYLNKTIIVSSVYNYYEWHTIMQNPQRSCLYAVKKPK